MIVLVKRQTIKLNFTVIYLTASSFQRSQFAIGAKYKQIYISKSSLTHFFSSAFYNIKKLEINQVKFTYFQNSPIILNKKSKIQDFASIYTEFPFYCESNTTLNISNSLFYLCQSHNSGGGLHFSSTNGILTLKDSVFHKCKSYMIGGAIYCEASIATINSTACSLCNAATCQASYFKIESRYDISYFLLHKCYIPSEESYLGPSLEINLNQASRSMVSYLNASYNALKSSSIIWPLISVKAISNLQYTTVTENYCATEIQFARISGLISRYMNLVRNHLKLSVFTVTDGSMVIVSNSFIGQDYGVVYFPKQTPTPSASPLATPHSTPSPPLPPLKIIDGSERRSSHQSRSKALNGADTLGGANGVHGGANGVHGGANGVHGGANGVHGGANSVHGGANGVHGGANGVHGGSDGVHGGANGVHGGANDVHGGANGVHGGAGGGADVLDAAASGPVLAIFPNGVGGIFFTDCLISYPEVENVICRECYVMSFETPSFLEFTLIDVDALLPVGTEARPAKATAKGEKERIHQGASRRMSLIDI